MKRFFALHGHWHAKRQGKTMNEIRPASERSIKKAVIYARFSTDLQNERSIEDQIALCRAYAERVGLTVIETYADRAKSGSSTIDRRAWQKLMRDADGRVFDIVVTEDIDRISRNEADYHAVRRRLTFLGIKIHTGHGGEISNIEGSVRAMLSALY